jgi:hypothetical protein
VRRRRFMKWIVPVFILWGLGCAASEESAYVSDTSGNEQVGAGEGNEYESGVDDSLLASGFEDLIVMTGGCANITLYGSSEDKNLGISFHVYGYELQELEAGATAVTPLDLAGGADVRVIMGHLIGAGYCVDIPLPDGAIEYTYVATAGKATLTVTTSLDEAIPGPATASATVVLEEVVLELQGGIEHTVHMGTVTLTGDVGWFAG